MSRGDLADCMLPSDSLQRQRYEPLPLGSVTPRGWIRRQLRIQADGITGNLDEHWAPLADNQWLGGTNDGWERGPYYADGLVPLAELLDDEQLRAKADTWVEGFLDWQRDDGWIGPQDPATGYSDDVWPRAVLLKVFRQQYEATGDQRVLNAALSFCELLRDGGLETYPLENWARFRWQELALGIQWLHQETGEDWLLGIASGVAAQGYDWRSHFSGHDRTYGFDYRRPTDDGGYETHVVNNAMGIKAAAVAYRQSGAESDRAAAANAVDTLDTYHGQATGVFTGDEHLAGRSPTRGTELCSVVEYMYSLEQLVATFGDVRFADRLERIAYNALPATFTPDMGAHQYDQQANQVLCAVGDYPWSNAPDANCFGLEPHWGCCTANLHQGWPKLVSHAWMRSDEGLAAVVYLPSAVTTDVDGTDVRVVEETAYPFGDEVRFTVETDGAVSFPLELRIPEWADDATVRLPDGTTRSPDAGGFHAVEREWDGRAEVVVDLHPSVRAERRHHGSVAVSRGPLVFSLPVGAESRLFPGERAGPHAHREFHPTEPWNYGLAVDTADPECSVERSDPGETPFASDDPPVTLSVEGARVDDWTLEGSRAGDVPASPVPGSEAESLTLVPYGCTTLRVTEFPLLD